MKKPKFSLGQGGIQGFFLQHVEKMVLVVVLLIVALYLYSGYSLEGYKPEKTPVDLKMTTGSTRDKMEKNTSDALAEESQRKPVTDYKDRADEGRKESGANNYPIGAINVPSFPPRYKRGDPKIYVPENILVQTQLASVYVQSPGEEDPFRNDSDALTGKPKKPSGSKPNKGKDDAGGIPGIGAPPGAPGSRPSGKSGDKNKDKEKGKGVGGLADLAGGDEGGFGGGAGGAGMQGGGGRVSEAHIKKYIYWTPRGGGQGPGGDNVSVVGKTQYIVSIVATFPYEKQFEEYQRVFADAEGYEPLRDSPRFANVIVERSEVAADPKAEPVWTLVKISKRFKNSWVEPAMPEVADEQYTDPALTIAMPPAVMIDPVKLGSHPLIPRAAASAAEDASQATKLPAADDAEEDEDDPSGGRPRRGSGGPADGMGPGIGPAGRPNAGGGKMGPPGMGAGSGSRPPAGMGAGGGNPGMQGMPGMPGMRGAGSAALGAKIVKHKLIRFFDFYAQPGKVYRYRVKVLLEDPNNPNPPPDGEFVPPEPRILENAVTVRINEQTAKSPDLDHLRESTWSEASATVTLPPPTNFVVGSVSIPRPLTISGIPIYTDDPYAVLLAVVWDKGRSINVPGRPVYGEDEKELEKPAVFRGTLLNFKRKATKVLRPDTLEIKSIKDYSYVTNALVVDLRPSEPLPVPKSMYKSGKEKPTPLTTAGEVLLVDNHGRFIVRNELDDTDDFRMYTFAEEEAKPSGGAGSDGVMPGMGAGSEGSGPGNLGAGALPGGAAAGGKKPGKPK